MRLLGDETGEVVQGEIGRRLQAARLERNITQADLADRAGISRRSLERLEAGETVRTTALWQTLRALDLLGALDRAIPDPDRNPNPLDLVRTAGRPRRRASRTTTGPEGEAGRRGDAGWRWGDEETER
ncbi:MAG: helix-turn-helix transcriptional regulator [Solirubrobacteraceae bacterium]|nr:helix-turn-helix transcriptional regulator [Solirubrobacteraceae bacterium]